MDPLSAIIQTNLGDALQAQGRFDDAARHYRRAIEIDPLMLGSYNPAEVAEVHRVPLGELTKPGVPRLRKIPQSDRPVLSIALVGTHVHAPTAAVLYQFREVAMLARTTRVAHIEQPVFAWT